MRRSTPLRAGAALETSVLALLLLTHLRLTVAGIGVMTVGIEL